jgi:hypothetical protein
MSEYFLISALAVSLAFNVLGFVAFRIAHEYKNKYMKLYFGEVEKNLSRKIDEAIVRHWPHRSDNP